MAAVEGALLLARVERDATPIRTVTRDRPAQLALRHGEEIASDDLGG